MMIRYYTPPCSPTLGSRLQITVACLLPRGFAAPFLLTPCLWKIFYRVSNRVPYFSGWSHLVLIWKNVTFAMILRHISPVATMTTLHLPPAMPPAWWHPRKCFRDSPTSYHVHYYHYAKAKPPHRLALSSHHHPDSSIMLLLVGLRSWMAGTRKRHFVDHPLLPLSTADAFPQKYAMHHDRVGPSWAVKSSRP